MQIPNLKALRERATFRDTEGKDRCLTQGELAARLEISQSQVSRYEDRPETVPAGLLLAWLAALGVDAMALASVGDESKECLLDPGKPLDELRYKLRLLDEYVRTAPEGLRPVDDARDDRDGDESLPTVDDLAHLSRKLARKPVLGLSGRFDAGKSRLANCLLGTDALPTGYQPLTRGLNFVRHVSDRPAWFPDDVWLMKPGFDPSRWDDEAHCEAHALHKGGLDLLRDAGYEGRLEAEHVKAALIYLDAPVLRACDILDLPGYQDEEEDEQRANEAAGMMDILLYLCPIKGFLNAADFSRIGHLLRQLPVVEAELEGVDPLANFLIVASHADPYIKDREVEEIFKKASARFYKQLGEFAIADRGRDAGLSITEQHVRDRMVPFWFELPRRRERPGTKLLPLLRDHVPVLWELRADEQVEGFKRQTTRTLSAHIDGWRAILDKREQSEKEYRDFEHELPRRRAEADTKRRAVEARIAACKREARGAISRIYEQHVNVDSVEAVIDQYQDKKEAQELAAPYLMEQLQQATRQETERLAGILREDIESYMKLYEDVSFRPPAFDSEEGVASIPFNARGAFLGGIAGLTAVGALAMWAASLGNLGAYIIAAKLVGVLSALGISISGGTAAVASALAAIGGPLTIAIGIVALMTFAGLALFGDRWQRRLAKKIVDTFREKEIQAKLEHASDEFWDGTLTAFRKGADALERASEEYLAKLKRTFDDPQASLPDLRARIALWERARAFFGSIPWRRSEHAARRREQ